MTSSEDLLAGGTICLSTYDSNHLLLIKGEQLFGNITTRPVELEPVPLNRPMGLFGTGSSLWVAGKSQLWRFDNLLSVGHEHEGYDGLFTPAASFRIGDVDSHELVVTDNGEPIFVNTAFSCLATIRPGCSFAPIWQPPFISSLVAEDRCHLNGVALQEGKPTWVTACSQGDSAAAWRSQRDNGGVVVHVPSGEICATGLSMPHSPRWYRNRLWILNSGSGEFGWIEESSGEFQCVCQLPGFARGITFHGDKALVTISKLRSPQSNGLAIAEQLRHSDSPDGACGIRVIDLNTGEIQGALDLPNTTNEIFDIAWLPGVQRASVLTNDSDDAGRLIKLPDRVELLSIRPKLPEPIAIAPGKSNLRYQCIYNLTPSNLEPYAALTFPSLAHGSNAQRRLRGELVGVCALAGEQMVGLVIAERRHSGDAQVVSMKVQPNWRRRGIGSRLMKNLLRCLHQKSAQSLKIQYQSGTDYAFILEAFLAHLGWSEPRDTFLLLEGYAERLSAVPWADNYPISPPYRLEPWQPHHSVQAKTLNAPQSLLTATNSQALDPHISLALLHNEQLVGWVLADRTTSSQVRYSSLYLESTHRGRARGLALLASAFRRQGELGPPVARAGVAPESISMVRFYKRHLYPYLASTSRARESEFLSPGPNES